MSDASSVVRALLIYGLCLPLAIFLGYLLAAPMDRSSFIMLGVLFAVLTIPIFLRWHHAWLVAFWNANMLAFFLPGRPTFALVMCAISLTISVLQHILNKRMKFLYVPTIAWPLFFLSAVVIATARLRGGIGLQSAGGESYGGKRYLLVLGAVIGYFALTARRIPFQKVKLYVGLFYLGALTSAMANLAGVISPALYFLFLIFPADPSGLGGNQNMVAGSEHISRLAGLAEAANFFAAFLLAMYGITGIFRKSWRTGLFAICFVCALYGGFRGHLIRFSLAFGILFYLEGMMRSRLLPILVLFGIFVGSVFFGFSDKMPLSIQRTMSFVPGIQIDPEVAADAKGSTDWRLDMWKLVVPDIPKYLILGKGYTFDPDEMAMIQSGMMKGEGEAAGSALAGDYHNGPLSIIMPFGIFGVIAFLWFLFAGIKVLKQNYRYGDPAFETINRFLLAQFIAKTVFFFAVFGSLYSDLPFFAGLLGLSVSINGGVRRPLPAPMAQPVVRTPRMLRPRLLSP